MPSSKKLITARPANTATAAAATVLSPSKAFCILLAESIEFFSSVFSDFSAALVSISIPKVTSLSAMPYRFLAVDLRFFSSSLRMSSKVRSIVINASHKKAGI